MHFCFIFYKVFAGALQGEPKNNIFQEKFVSSQFGIHIAQLNLMVSDWDFPKKIPLLRVREKIETKKELPPELLT